MKKEEQAPVEAGEDAPRREGSRSPPGGRSKAFEAASASPEDASRSAAGSEDGEVPHTPHPASESSDES